MSWQIVHKQAYLSDFIGLPKKVQQRAVKAIKALEQTPIVPHGNTVMKLGGYQNVWRYRLGDYRMIFAVADEPRLIQLLAIGHRNTVYKRFRYKGWNEAGAGVHFGPSPSSGSKPQHEAIPEWTNHPEWFQPLPAQPEKLPRRLTPALLSRWRIPPEFHSVLTRCRTVDDLLTTEVPSVFIGPVLDGLYPPSVDQIALEPDQMLFRPEDLEDYAEGELTDFLLRLDKDQLSLVDWALDGPTLVKGGPGSGKSTIAIYRIGELVKNSIKVKGIVPSVLLITYTNALVLSNKSLLRQLLQVYVSSEQYESLLDQIHVTTLDDLAYQIVRLQGEYFKIATKEDRLQALRLAYEKTSLDANGDLGNVFGNAELSDLRRDYLLEEFDWIIEGQNCSHLEDYLSAVRAGRGIRFNEKRRQIVWELYAEYRDYLESRKRYTHGYLLQRALSRIQNNEGSSRHWQYVLVDEAQDLPPLGIALCMELCSDPSGLFLTADANQSIYNRGFRWTGIHDDLNIIGKTRILHRNYRCTKEIGVASAQILRSGKNGNDIATFDQEFVHNGMLPLLYASSSKRDQTLWIAEQILSAARNLRESANSAVVLVNTAELGRKLAKSLTEENFPAEFIEGEKYDPNYPRAKVTTLNTVKGLEAPIVIVAHVEAGQLPPNLDGFSEPEIEPLMEEQRRRFYVGCTRAIKYLAVTYDQQIPSPFLNALKEGHWIRVKSDDVDGFSKFGRWENVIQRGESQTVEFKSTYEWNFHRNKHEPKRSMNCVKSIAAFLNQNGGTLFIGVEDDGKVRGIEDDLSLVGKSHDEFESKIRSKISDLIGKQYGDLVKIHIETLKGNTVCVVKVEKAKKWAFVQGKFFCPYRQSNTRVLRATGDRIYEFARRSSCVVTMSLVLTIGREYRE